MTITPNKCYTSIVGSRKTDNSAVEQFDVRVEVKGIGVSYVKEMRTTADRNGVLTKKVR